ncbi:MAG: S8 family serine peptidase, partial [Bacteroidales bacterium]|nr:S8 family serine peptidase [Bacteroidales bacterium]
MKKIVFTLLAISLLASAMAQSTKCAIDTKALVREEIAAGAQSINFLAKMTPGFDRGVLEKADIVIGAEAGLIVTLRVPVTSLDVLESDKEVLLYSISHRIAEPTCDHMRVDTRTDSVQKGLGTIDNISYNGAGVYIGITDWGFDYTHPNYNGQNHNTWRIARAWDHFRLAGPPPAGFDFGTEIVGYERLIAAQGDTSNLYGYGTHGTHVAGITTGKGFRGNYRGQAPGARLLLCSFGLGEYEWMQGVAWMRKVAEDSG